MASLVQTIVANVSASLAAISPQAGYLSKVDAVVNYPIANDFLPTIDIILAVYGGTIDGNTSEVRSSQTNSASTPTEITINIRAVLRTDPDSSENARQNLITDILRAMYKDRRQGIAGVVDTVGFNFSNLSYTGSAQGIVLMFDAVFRIHALINPLNP